MANARIYGRKSVCIPNREADMRRRNNAFWKGREYALNYQDRFEAKQERQLRKMKEESYGK